jgi:hypothetical protein
MNNPQAKPEIWLELLRIRKRSAPTGNYTGASALIQHGRHCLPPGTEPEQGASTEDGAKDQGPGADPGEGVPRPNPGGPNRGWDSAALHSV